MTGIGIILAGGKADRLGGVDKGALVFDGVCAAERVRSVLAPSLTEIRASVAHDFADDLYHGVPVIRDDAGSADDGLAMVILGCLHWAQTNEGASYLVTSPVDTPFLPADFAARLVEASAGGQRPVCIRSGGRVHGLHALWPLSIYPTLDDFVRGQGKRKIELLHEEINSVYCDFGPEESGSFLNINTPQDLAGARQADT